jgi:alpha/beta superfamily hydrolase
MDLPPPPLHPELPPEVRIAGEEETVFRTEDGVQIQALAYVPAQAERVAVLCHPHPLYGGTMHNAIVVVVAKRLRERGQSMTGGGAAGTPPTPTPMGPDPSSIGWLRLNYRGVGKSEGKYGAGKAEIFDVRAAFAEVRRRAPRAKLSLVGYSFGAGVGYGAAVKDGGIDNIALVAPSPRMMQVSPLGEFAGPIQIVAASQDQFCDPEETTELARRLGAGVKTIEGADHYFVRFRREVASLVVSFISPELAS